MALYSFIGVAVTSATIIIYGETIWNPVDIPTNFKDPVALVIAMVSFASPRWRPACSVPRPRKQRIL